MPSAASIRPTCAEVDLEVLAGNIRALKDSTRPGAALMAVVKADGYGHGALQVARTAQAAGAEWLGVAIPEEGLQLRRAGIGGPILVLGWTPPAQAASAVQADLTLTVSSLAAARDLALAARGAGLARVHLKVDTGMGRLGVLAGREGLAEAVAICRLPGLSVEGAFTHFAAADEPDRTFTYRQLELFQDFLARLEQHRITFALRHAANTAALVDLPESHLDLVRPGLGLYGYLPSQHVQRPPGLRPALTWRTQVSHVKVLPAGSPVGYGRTYHTVRPTVIATLPVGYADGYPRSLSNAGDVLLHSRRCRIAGRVCMDQLMVEVPDGMDIRVGDEVILLGRQGGDSIDADELAARAGTIAHEILTGIGPRVPRVHLHRWEGADIGREATPT
ncbi:MAG TPA: alanine racemase [Bacillota bacterium]|nr:alanine racemase [Bacillota bacterium]